MGLSLETLFGFGYTVRLRTSCLDVRESIVKAGMCDSFGIMELSGKQGEKREHCTVSVKELGAGGCSGVFISFVSWGVLTAEGETPMDMISLLLIYTPLFASS